MRTLFITYLLIALLAFTILQPILADEQLKPDVILARSKPAVFKILAGAEVDTSYPGVTLRGLDSSPCQLYGNCSFLLSILYQDYKSDRAAHRTDYPELTYAWVKIASDPARYLDVAKTWLQSPQLDHESTYFSSGSGFAVSQGGILLTNAHVVAPPNANDLKNNFFDRPLERAVAKLVEQLGGGPPRDRKFLEILVKALTDWLAPKGTITLQRAEIRVIMKRSEWNRAYSSDVIDSLLARAPQQAELNGWKTYSIPADILTSGVPLTASDVAVIRLNEFRFPNMSQLKSTPDLNPLRQPTHRLICLPLGDSDEVHNPVHAMGFPGRVSRALNENPAIPQLIVHPGEVSAVIDPTGPLLHMSATISQGDSGGPVVDSYGAVVGLNVFVLSNTEGDTFAIPINTAKKFLAKMGITPIIGPESTHWFAAQEAFDQQRYSSAYRELQAITDPVDPKHISSNSDADAAIADLATVCDKRIKEGRDKSGMLDRTWYKLKY